MRPTARKRIAAAAALAAVALLAVTARAADDPGAAQIGVRCGPMQTSGSSGTHGGGGLMIPVTLDQVTDESSVVVVGTVTSFQSCTRGTPGSIFTLVTVAPEQVLKGAAGKAVRLSVPGGSYGGYGLGVGTSPEFTAGERTVVFAGPQGDDLAPVQGYQSKLIVAPDGGIPGTSYTLDRLVANIRKAAKGGLTESEDFSLAGAAAESATYQPLGPTWPAGAIPVAYNINVTDARPAQLSAQAVRRAIANALHTWQNEGNSYMAFGPLAETTRTSAQNARCDARNDTTFGIDGPHAVGTLAISYTCFFESTNEIQDADVEIDVDHFGSAWQTNGAGDCFDFFDLETVLLHEYGHALGLSHPSAAAGCTSCPVMDATYGGVQRTLCPDDAAGVVGLYPLTAGAPPPPPGNPGATRNETVTVTWTDVASELGYELWRAPLPCATTLAVDFRFLDSVADGVQSYVDNDYGNGLNASTTYCYKLRSFNTSGTSGFSGGAQSNEAPLPQTLGDVDCDGDVDAVDALGVLRHVATLTGGPACIASGDTDCGGTIAATDALRILRHVAGLQPLVPC